VACGYALCAWSIKTKANQELSDEERQRYEQCVTKAVETLKSAIKNGYRCPAEIKNNPDLEEIRQHPDFASLLELAASPINTEM
jgi:hypothetical protein